MGSDAPTTLVEHFSILEDTRDPSKCRNKLIDMIVIAIAAVLCGADDLANIEAFGKAKIDWFRRFLELENGIPSHDTFGRVFAMLSPKAFQASFRAWVESVRAVYEDEVIASDGKTLRRSHDRKAGLGPLRIVSARDLWTDARITGIWRIAGRTGSLCRVCQPNGKAARILLEATGRGTGLVMRWCARDRIDQLELSTTSLRPMPARGGSKSRAAGSVLGAFPRTGAGPFPPAR